MQNQVENIAELAAQLIIDGKSSVKNAFEMALKIDSEKCLDVIEDMADMRGGYVNDLNKNQKAYEIILEGAYNNFPDKK